MGTLQCETVIIESRAANLAFQLVVPGHNRLIFLFKQAIVEV